MLLVDGTQTPLTPQGLHHYLSPRYKGPTEMGFLRTDNNFYRRTLHQITDKAANIENVLTGMETDVFYVDCAQILH